MLDIHSHILPAIDDGAQTDADTLRLLKKAVSEGISDIIATPHNDPTYPTDKLTILEKVKHVNAMAHENDIPITVYPGQEVRIYPELLENLDKHVMLLENTSYILIEFPSDHVPMYAEKIFYDLQLKGIQPILVHPERNEDIIKNPNILYDFVNRGVLTQITAGSLVGKFGKQIKKLSIELVNHELIHFVASDAHKIGARDFNIQKARKLLVKKFGREYTDSLFKNADSIKTNTTIYSGYPEPFK